MNKKTVFFIIFFIPLLILSQLKIKVTDENGFPLSNAKITYNQKEYSTDKKGGCEILITKNPEKLTVEKEGYTIFNKIISSKDKIINISLISNESVIEEVFFQKSKKNKSTDLTSVEISPLQVKQSSTLSGGIENLLKTLPSVNSNSELSSQYMIRGGNFDENLIYINDIEIHRPFLVRNSQQEGMSIINPDMVSSIKFSAGGFEAKYGDKMSSSLNIYYREAENTELSGELSLIENRLSTGFKENNKRFSILLSARHRNTNLVLNTLNEKTDFNPQYIDFQLYTNYKIYPKWSFSFVGYWSKNNFSMIPQKREIDFGSLQNPMKVTVFYGGREIDSYHNTMGTLSLRFIPNKKWRIMWDNFTYRNREREYYSIISAYQLETSDPVSGIPITSYDIGAQIDHARNDLSTQNIGSQIKIKFSPDINTHYEAGTKIEKEYLEDLINEWKLLEYKGYNSVNLPLDLRKPNTSPLNLMYHISGENNIKTFRFSGYVQYSKKMYWKDNKIFLNVGIRKQYWNFNKETLVSPRLQFAIKPNWKLNTLFKISGGMYYQAPFYKEIKDLDGKLNSGIKAQKSFQIILGNNLEFQWKKRNFKLSTEAYYKKMEKLIPYYVDNVRIRYSGNNNSKGYTYGMDTRFFGEFVPGVDSWFSAGYSRTFENIESKGYISRPTDQNLRLSMFYQDYMPHFPSMRVNLTLIYSSGLPTGSPIIFNKTTGKPDFNIPYQIQRRLPSYKRVDIGLTKIFIEKHKNLPTGNFWRSFQELSLSIQIFNAFNIRNTIANQWITDFSTQHYYPVPVRLTGRFFNIKVNFKL